ncbi:carbohydrate ABC transporter permease [Lacrimispora saccharolytica]|uniref:Binding-protein-dependent transport systems inner membrane component n=1 Tax=Lacrimispora saccharolytica (strain ATCC 35040 / DSM 2544 / NRCC 2533 / WM1) TaxID=610130 RepID=D9R8E2_LACSW|nr:sugar ABC transporter permease [Lacrimispora saccharolytica]ADL03894.1 binding-protein-dependent transport systems inner membrane component [[Clostridium] saccharolyticum WM1]QRV21794.1 sugar ABC transporter permease [Lacrimispora saccharolytica]
MLKTWNKYKAPYLFILPFFLLFLVFQLIPSLWTIAISLTNWKGIGTPEFCGMDNYKKLVIDNMFWEALRNTVVYWITGLVFILALSVLIASLLNSDMLRGRAFFRTVTFLPNICAAIAMGLIFRMLFDENAGLINELMVFVGFEKVPWLTSTRYSRIPVIMLNVWRNTPWFTMIVFSGLLNISRDYYEAATVDGANRWKQFCYITLPSLGNILFFCSITLTVDSWKLFNESYILPGPGTSNTSLFQYMYESGFNIFNMGYASAIGVILIVILAVLSMVQMIVKKRQGEW